MNRSKVRVLLSAFAAVALAAGGCGKSDNKSNQSSKPAAGGDKGAAGGDKAAAPTGHGTIVGKVNFTGTPPEMPELKRDADPVCAKKKMKAETVVVNENKTLRNVLVRIKPGTVKGPAPTEPVEIHQQDCMYRPRVQGAVADQDIKIVNTDPTTHNVHTFDMREGEGEESLFNLAQPKGAAPITKNANGYQVIKFKCDVHPWMLGYIVVSDHPYFAVTGDDGTFKIENVPAGKYTLEAWHEHYGMKTAEVTVTDKGTAEVAFSYDGTEKPL
ncbi:MAG: DUF2012 domain-containing protein [Deltaproteobacteria bacterium]|nr:MAG: DUF2012 domain-containing protein [Deltaproteobacteria bacterium]